MIFMMLCKMLRTRTTAPCPGRFFFGGAGGTAEIILQINSNINKLVWGRPCFCF
jgi:hypothetical protein